MTKVFHGGISGVNIYKDIMAVLAKYKGKTMIVMDTVGETNTTGNMGKLVKYFRNNHHRHTYCMDHNFHLNAKHVAFKHKSKSHITYFTI